MSLKIPVAHDFTCSWCYVGLFQVERLKRDFDVEFDWRAYELWPESLPWPTSVPTPEIPNKPPTPTRHQLLLAAENLEMPKVERPRRMRSHLAHLATEFAKEHGREELLIPALYRAYWEQGEYINEVEFLCNLGKTIDLDPDAMRASIESAEFDDRIVLFDAPAYKTGIFNLPTFTIAGERYAQQPYRALEKAVAEATKEIG